LIKQVLIPAVILCIASSGLRPNCVAGHDPVVTGSIELPGLSAPVTINYDHRGVPFIEAKNDDDLYFAQGYIVARDRLWQMDLTRRTCRGQLAEVLGGAALESDRIHRTYGFAELAGQVVPTLQPKVRASVQAYSRGVNAYIQSLNDQSLPVEFRLLHCKPSPWQPADCVLVGKVFAEALSDSWRFDLIRAMFAGVDEGKQKLLFQTKSSLDVLLSGTDRPTGPPRIGASIESPVTPVGIGPARGLLEEASVVCASVRSSLERIGFSASGMAASNNWVVSGRHSVTGKPLLANDPHLSPSAPSIWYMISLAAGGFHCEGVTVPGAPGVFIGHNDQVAWGITNVEADVQDLFLERFDESRPGQYLSPDGWRPAVTRHEEIKVRKSLDDPATMTAGLDVTVTRHGPIILEKNDQRYALAWPALDPQSKELEVYYDINHSNSCRAMEKALGHYSGFPLNFVYADTAGHIGWWAQGRYPIRNLGHGTVPQQGWTGAGDWTGYIPPAETPHVYDPASGIIVTANNRTIGATYPFYLGELWAEPYRARRIYDLLAERLKLSPVDFERIQADTYSVPAVIFAAQAVKMAGSDARGSSEWAALTRELKGWDGNAAADSRTMLITALMRRTFASKILEGAFGPDLARQFSWPSYIVFDELIQEQPQEWLPSEFKSYPDLVIACYRQTLEDLEKRFGTDSAKWKWGEFVKVRFLHALSQATLFGPQFEIPAFGQNGSSATINNGSSVSMRFVADLADWDNCRLGITLGQSGDPKSSHWKDQLEDWRNVTPGVFPFNRKTVDAASRSQLVLVPLK
jgi:penicillin amidase